MSSSSTPPMSTLEAAFNAAKRALSFTPLKLGAIARDRDPSAHPLPDDDPTVAAIELSGIVEGTVHIAIGEEYLERLEYTSKSEGLVVAVQGTVDAISTALHPLGDFDLGPTTEVGRDDWPSSGSPALVISAPLTDHDEVVARIAFALTYHAVKEGTTPRGEEPGEAIAVVPTETATAVAVPSTEATPAAAATLDAATAREIALLADVEVEVRAILGRKVLPLHELLAWLPGSIVTLDRVAGTPADVCVGETVVAVGDVVVVEEMFGVRVTDVVMRGPSAPSVGVSRS